MKKKIFALQIIGILFSLFGCVSYDEEDKMIIDFLQCYDEVENSLYWHEIPETVKDYFMKNKEIPVIPVCYTGYLDSIKDVSETIAAEFWTLYSDIYGIDIPTKARDKNTGKFYSIDELCEKYPNYKDFGQVDIPGRAVYNRHAITLKDKIKTEDLCGGKRISRIMYAYLICKKYTLPNSIQFTQWVYKNKSEGFTRLINLFDNFAIITTIEGETIKNNKAFCEVIDNKIRINELRHLWGPDWDLGSQLYTFYKENDKIVLIKDSDETRHKRTNATKKDLKNSLAKMNKNW